MFRRATRRWSDNQKQWGPFTHARDTGEKPLGIAICSGDEDHPGCHLMLRGFGHTVIVELPPILKPWREQIIAGWDPATIERIGRNWYWNVHEQEFGFTYRSDGFLQVFFGAQTMDSKTTKVWCKTMPWKEYRQHRECLYGLEGEEVYRKIFKPGERYDFEAWRAAKAACPKVAFLFLDCDGERILASTHIEESEYRRGFGYFRWMSWFWPSRVRRSLSIEFSSEVGPEKGSWKGGMTGHGIDMLPGELHEAAFRRYCRTLQKSKYREYWITFVRRVPQEMAGDLVEALRHKRRATS